MTELHAPGPPTIGLYAAGACCRFEPAPAWSVANGAGLTVACRRALPAPKSWAFIAPLQRANFAPLPQEAVMSRCFTPLQNDVFCCQRNSYRLDDA